MLAGGDTRAEFDDLSFQVRGIDFELMDQLVIDEERRMRRFGLVRPVAVQHEAKAVLGVHGEAVDEMRGIGRAQSGFVVMEQVLGKCGASARIVDADGAG